MDLLNYILSKKYDSVLNYLQVFILLFASLLVWRCWKFTIIPKLYPRRPKTLPYWVPWIGHSISFFMNADATLNRGRLYFGNRREPFCLVLGGQIVYIITSAKDVSTVYRNVEDFGFNQMVKDVLIRFGASPEGVARVWDPPQSKSGKPSGNDRSSHSCKTISNHCEDIMKIQLHPGPKLEKLQDVLLTHLHQTLSWDLIPPALIIKETATEKIVSLEKWVQCALLEVVTRSFYGDAIFKIEPSFLENFARFDDSGWKLMYQVPSALSQDMLTAKTISQIAFDKYFDLPSHERSDASWMIQNLESELRDAGSSIKDISAYLLLLYWAINANAWKAIFWLIAHIVHDPSLKQAIEDEILPHLSRDLQLSPAELQERLENCPVLVAAYHETLRLTASPISARDVIRDCKIRDFKLQKGARVIIPYRQMLLDEAVFGLDAHKFNPQRFIQRPMLSKSSSFKPFGGGLAYCPGRYIAKREILTLTALLLGRFQLEIHDKNNTFPEMDAAKPCLGVMKTLGGGDIVLNVRPRL